MINPLIVEHMFSKDHRVQDSHLIGKDKAQGVKTTSARPVYKATKPKVKYHFHRILVLEGNSGIMWSILPFSEIPKREAANISLHTLHA